MAPPLSRCRTVCSAGSIQQSEAIFVVIRRRGVGAAGPPLGDVRRRADRFHNRATDKNRFLADCSGAADGVGDRPRREADGVAAGGFVVDAPVGEKGVDVVGDLLDRLT